MFRNACQQMTRLAAILAVALLCAQTVVVTHDHEPVDGALCAVCSTASDAAPASEPPALHTAGLTPPRPEVRQDARALRRQPNHRLPRAPPTA